MELHKICVNSLKISKGEIGMSKKKENKIDSTNLNIKQSLYKIIEVKDPNNVENIIKIKVKINPSCLELSAIVDAVCDIVCGEYHNNLQDYSPMLEDIAERIVIVSYLTDYTLPEEFEKAEEILSDKNGIFKEIMNVICTEDENFYTKITIGISKKTKVYLDAMSYNLPFQNISNQINNFADGFINMFKDFNVQDILQVVDKLKDTDQNSIVDKILEYKEKTGVKKI